MSIDVLHERREAAPLMSSSKPKFQSLFPSITGVLPFQVHDCVVGKSIVDSVGNRGNRCLKTIKMIKLEGWLSKS